MVDDRRVCITRRLLVLGIWLCFGARVCLAEAGAPESLSFPQALEQILGRHPALKAAQQRLAGSQAWAEGAGAQPNPVVRLSVPVGDPSEEANELVQRLEIGGQPGLRSQIASLQVDQADARLMRQRLELSAQAADAYYSLWAARETEQLLALDVQLAGALHTAAQQKLQAGEIAETQGLRAELELAQSQARLASAAADSRLALNRLNLLLGRPAQQQLGQAPLEPLAEDEATVVPGPSRDDLVASVASRPEVRVANSAARIAHLEADLLGRQRLPDFEFEAYRSSLGAGAEQGVRASLVIPLWDWGQTAAAAEQRRREALAVEQDALSQRQQAEQQLLEAWELLVAERERRTLLRGQTTRYLKQLDLARRGYTAGLLSLPEVLEAQRAYREATLSYVSAEAAFRKRRWGLVWWSTSLPVSAPVSVPVVSPVPAVVPPLKGKP